MSTLLLAAAEEHEMWGGVNHWAVGAGHARHPGDRAGHPGRLRRRTRAQLSTLATPPTSAAHARRRVGVMGGTFDPIHHGHLVAASEVQAWFDLDEVVFVPTGAPWQKSERVVSEAEDRYLMTVIATAANPRFWVSRVDIDRDGPTYTIDTLRDLREQMPDVDLYFITGADALADIFTWRDAEELFELANFVGCTRPGYTMDPATLNAIPSDRVTMVEIPALAISSTDCRDRKRRGEPVWYLVPDGVVQYIAKHDLYAALTQGSREVTATDRAVELVVTAARAASDKLASQIVAFDVSDQLAITDAFLIASGSNDRQVKAIVDAVEEKLREVGAKPLRREGERDGRWVLIDYGEIVVHIQHEEERQFYALERLWRDCPAIPLPADVVSPSR